MPSLKTPISIFTIAFFLNLIWENAQAPFYQGYVSFWQHFWICLPAVLWDTIMITLFYLLLTPLKKIVLHFFSDRLKSATPVAWGIVIVVALITAAVAELRAIAQGRWAYTAAMPLLPFTRIGLLPFLQLAILSITTYWLVPKLIKR